MRRPIVVMDEELSGKIAAGEVVERPASIVKELIENSLDAGATDILIELENGGKHSIRVNDNGEGMEREDAILAFERYATSKIRTFDDMYTIHSFGFRGEALPSIASIAKCEILTRTRESPSGTRILLERGVITEVIEAGCPVGTSLHVRDIFYSTPARKKFLKKDSTEQAHCIDAIVRLAFAHPHVRMRLVTPKREVLDVPGTDNLNERISIILGEDLTKNFIPVEKHDGNIRIEGFVSKPVFTRSNTKGIFYYVNGRFIRDSLLNNAIMTPYRRVIEARRYPSAVIFITVPPEDVDVNVHPTKMEVRFSNPWSIHSAVVKALTSSLADVALSSDMSHFYPSGTVKTLLPEYRQRVRESLKRYTVMSGSKTSFSGHQHGVHRGDGTEQIQDYFMQDTSSGQAVTFSSLRYLDQIAGTYLLFSAPDGAILVDQHAAHERVLFEQMKSTCREKGGEKQTLLIPEVISLTPADYIVVKDHCAFLNDIGFEIEGYSGNTVIVRSVPTILSDVDLKLLIPAIIEEVEKTGRSTGIQEVRDKILTRVACQCAVKAHHKLTRVEVEGLCRDLDAIPFASTCPHGRPIFIKFDTRDLEKMFRRK
ncbi:MAG: DNA mismatch repair endonuclease MutL [Deltaproteobacteria bacterium]|nr:DNA mismatch repair endonuclease MutL [Deltaproteobacteria bacterium]